MAKNGLFFRSDHILVGRATKITLGGGGSGTFSEYTKRGVSKKGVFLAKIDVFGPPQKRELKDRAALLPGIVVYGKEI
jgi:hypothetical protein